MLLHDVRKKKSKKQWLERAAQEMDIEIDEMYVPLQHVIALLTALCGQTLFR